MSSFQVRKNAGTRCLNTRLFRQSQDWDVNKPPTISFLYSRKHATPSISQDNFRWSQRQLSGEYIKLLNINKLNAITMFHSGNCQGRFEFRSSDNRMACKLILTKCYYILTYRMNIFVCRYKANRIGLSSNPVAWQSSDFSL